MKLQKIKAFTLVELIIVITILAILRTIGFMSFQSYTLDARDGKRKRDLGVLRNGLEIYGTKNQTLLDPDNYVTISGSSLQGYASGNTLKGLRISDDTKDPKDKIYYTYSKDLTGKKYQLLAMLEKQDNLAYNQNTKFINETYALDYSTRFPYTLGGNFGIYLSGTIQIPIQEGNAGQTITDTGSLTLITSNTGTSSGGSAATCSDSIQNQDETGVDCGGSCTACALAYNQATLYVKGDSFTYDSMTWYVSKNTKVAYTKPSLTNDLPNNLTSTDHILVFSGNEKYILKTVNQGATQVYNYGTSYTSGRLWNEGATTNYGADSATRKIAYEADKSMLGDYYQWGRNDPVSLTGTTTSLDNTHSYQTGGVNYATNYGFIINPNSPYSWLGTNHASSSSIIWTDANNPGPCLDANYRLPTTSTSVGLGEWRRVVEIVTGKTASWLQADRETLQKYLLLPFAGIRNFSTGDFNTQGSNGNYWSSSINGGNGHDLYFNSTGIDPGNNNRRASGFSVRCFKN